MKSRRVRWAIAAASLLVASASADPVTTLRYPVTTLDGLPRPFDLAETATETRFSLAGDVLFDFDRADIRPQAGEALRALSTAIVERFGRERLSLRIEGHTDSKGDDSYNQTLSERRAASVSHWLKKNGEVVNATFTTHGFGEKQPVAPNTNADGSDYPEGRQKNRRVEIVVQRTS